MDAVVSGAPSLAESDSEETLIDLVKRLLELGADPNAIFGSPHDYTYYFSDVHQAKNKSALHLAAARGEQRTLKVLIDAGALLELKPVLSLPPTQPPEVLGPTALGCAMDPPWGSPIYNSPRRYLETIITLLELGASLKNSGLTVTGPEADPKSWLAPLFRRSDKKHPRSLWYSVGLFEPFEKIVEFAMRGSGCQQVPKSWPIYWIYLAVTEGPPGEDFCKWCVPPVCQIFPAKQLYTANM
jgi:hypothetical protein